MNAKEELTKLLMESYDQGVKDGLETSLQLVKERLAQPEQEPVAWVCEGFSSDEKHGIDYWQGDVDDLPIGTQLYTTPPPQRTWVGLTAEEIQAFDTWHDNREEEVGWCNPSEIVAYIEARLKEKNT